MSKEYLADKPTLDEVNEKMGDAEGSSIFAKLNSIISAIADHVAIWTAAKAGNLDTTVSSRAPASTALSTTHWTNTRAGYLDKLNSGVAVSSLAGKLVKSVQRGVATVSANSSSVTITITAVNTARSIVLYGGNAKSHIWGAALELVNSTTLKVTAPGSHSEGIPIPWQVVEFY